MKLIHALSIAALATAPAAHAQSDHMKGMDMGAHANETAKAPQANAHHATGVVKSVNASKGTVTIAHGPVESLNWPGMTMAFKTDKKTLEKARPGTKVSFEFEQRGKDYVITSLQ